MLYVPARPAASSRIQSSSGSRTPPQTRRGGGPRPCALRTPGAGPGRRPGGLDFAVTGITNKSLRAWMTGLLGAPYGMNQASYDLARLRGNGLIDRIARTNTYDLTADGLAFAVFYTKVHDQVLYPLTAHDQPIAAPAPVRAAWRTITRISTAPSPPPASDARPDPCPRSALSPDSAQPSKSSPHRALRSVRDFARKEWPFAPFG